MKYAQLRIKAKLWQVQGPIVKQVLDFPIAVRGSRMDAIEDLLTPDTRRRLRDVSKRLRDSAAVYQQRCLCQLLRRGSGRFRARVLGSDSALAEKIKRKRDPGNLCRHDRACAGRDTGDWEWEEDGMTSAAASTILPSPDFTCDLANGCKYDAGLRPWREGTYRLEPVQAHGKLLIHNYGHGGAGITMSWGCANAVREIVRQNHSPGPTHRVAVLGAGVMALTAAALLREARYEVKIYAETLSRTTSDVAGGQWSPSLIEHDPAKEAEFFALLRTAHAMHKARLGNVYGVSERLNYCLAKPVGLEKAVKAGAIGAPQTLNLPFQHLNQSGFAYKTLLVEPPIFLERLRHELRQQNVPFLQKSFISEQEVWGLAEPIVINCTGLGARKLFNDPKMKPKKGQLVLLKPQPGLDYLYSTGSTYVFPRSDCVVVGGTEEDDDYDCRPIPARCRQILRAAVGVFSGMPAHLAAPEPWMIRNK